MVYRVGCAVTAIRRAGGRDGGRRSDLLKMDCSFAQGRPLVGLGPAGTPVTDPAHDLWAHRA